MNILNPCVIITLLLGLGGAAAPSSGSSVLDMATKGVFLGPSKPSERIVESKPDSSKPEELAVATVAEGSGQGSQRERAVDSGPASDEPSRDSSASSAPETTKGRVSEEARPLVEKVQRFYENTDDFTATFEQTYTYQVGREVKSRGKVAFKKPAMMRWDYEHPRERAFVVDGSDLWIWTPEDFTAVRQRDFTASDLSTSITFLWGEGRLENEFHIELEGDERLSLTPIRPEGSFQRVVFRVDTETGRVMESTVIDPQGNRNHMVFSQVSQNTGIDRERFAFSPPSGADVQDMPSIR